MDRKLIYLDQNIIGLHIDGELTLSTHPGHCWVYSKEHFAEIRRSTNPDQFLSVLDEIGAKMLELQLDADWRITGIANLIENGTPAEHYEAYIEATSSAPACDGLFEPLLAWVNGGRDEGPFRQLPERLAEQVLMLTRDLPVDHGAVADALDVVVPEFTETIKKMMSHGNDITKTRKALGDGKGTIGSVSGEGELQQIWRIIEPVCAGVTCDQFFGFDPIDKQGYENWPLYLGIVSCCAVMDIVGFQAEQKCRKLDKISNVRSDAGHIAMGAYCSAILSGDGRLIRRARAIYQYKGIGTAPLLFAANKSMQPTANASAD